MPRKKKQDVRINDTASLEGLLQETYNDALLQITEVQSVINELSANVNAETSRSDNDLTIEDLTKIAKEKGGLLKVKDSAIRTKLDIARLQSDIIKNSGNAAAGVAETTQGVASLDDMQSIRDWVKNNRINDNLDS